jgi:hypothetical protein
MTKMQKSLLMLSLLLAMLLFLSTFSAVKAQTVSSPNVEKDRLTIKEDSGFKYEQNKSTVLKSKTELGVGISNWLGFDVATDAQDKNNQKPEFSNIRFRTTIQLNEEQNTLIPISAIRVGYTKDFNDNNQYVTAEMLLQWGVGDFVFVTNIGGTEPITDSHADTVYFVNNQIKYPIYQDDIFTTDVVGENYYDITNNGYYTGGGLYFKIKAEDVTIKLEPKVLIGSANNKGDIVALLTTKFEF